MPRLDVSDHALASCVGCGLCLPHCPTFRVTGDESRSPRGRIEIMRALNDDRLDFDSEVVEALDTCVQCLGCEPACPSGVPYGELIEATQVLRRREQPIPFWLRIGLRALPHRRVLETMTRLGGSLARLGVLRRFGPLPIRLGPRLRSTSTTPDVWIFTGCVMDAWQRQVHRAVADVVHALGLTYGVVDAGHCCGALHSHAGWREGALDRAHRTMAAFPGEQPILVDSAGCGAAMKGYDQLVDTEDARLFSSRVSDVHEWLAGHLDRLATLVVDETDRRPTVVLQDPCHLRHVQKVHGAVRRCLHLVSDVIELDDEGLCCGAGGAFSLLQPDLATSIRDRKLRAIGRADPESRHVVASANPGCAQHLSAAGVEIVHPIEIVARSLRTKETT